MVQSMPTRHVQIILNPFQLQITALVRKRPLRATWATTAAPTLPTAAGRKPTLFFVTERGFNALNNVFLNVYFALNSHKKC